MKRHSKSFGNVEKKECSVVLRCELQHAVKLRLSGRNDQMQKIKINMSNNEELFKS